MRKSNQRGPNLTSEEVRCCERRSLRSPDFSGASGSAGVGGDAQAEGDTAADRMDGEPNPVSAVRAGIGERAHRSISGAAVCGGHPHKTPREPTLSTDTWAGGFLGRSRKDTACGWAGKKNRGSEYTQSLETNSIVMAIMLSIL